ncbi:MAG: hypothetical protein O8C64_14455 [Candidatus Methanoperedens sp.]|nr:hypothetical protein [Candidatus Methanoperedens sp.]MCZ7405040.1 hypothetical protein [Candidatus Methanoperedens sp.]
MSETVFNHQILNELVFLKEKILKIEMEVGEINDDLHQVRPEYLKKLEAIKKEGTVSSAEFEKKFGKRI